MRFESAEAIEAFLAANRGFEEAVLENVEWQHYGTVFECLVESVRDPNGTLRDRSVGLRRTVLTFRNVIEFHMENDLHEAIVLEPDKLNWGFSEFARLRLIDGEAVLAKYAHLPIPVHEMCFVWESNLRRIRIVFSTMDVGE